MTDQFSVIGKPLPKVDAGAKVTGQAVYADDVVLPRTLHCKILRSPHPHARIKSIDTSAARRIGADQIEQIRRGLRDPKQHGSGPRISIGKITDGSRPRRLDVGEPGGKMLFGFSGRG